MKVVATVGNYTYERDELGRNHSVVARNFRIHAGDVDYVKELYLTIGYPSKELATKLAEGVFFTITIDMPD